MLCHACAITHKHVGPPEWQPPCSAGMLVLWAYLLGAVAGGGSVMLDAAWAIASMADAGDAWWQYGAVLSKQACSATGKVPVHVIYQQQCQHAYSHRCWQHNLHWFSTLFKVATTRKALPPDADAALQAVLRIAATATQDVCKRLLWECCVASTCLTF